MIRITYSSQIATEGSFTLVHAALVDDRDAAAGLAETANATDAVLPCAGGTRETGDAGLVGSPCV